MYIIPGGDRGVGIRRKGSEKCTEDGKRRVGRGFPGWWEKGEREKHNTTLHNILELKVKRGEKKRHRRYKKGTRTLQKNCTLQEPGLTGPGTKMLGAPCPPPSPLLSLDGKVWTGMKRTQ